MPESAAKMRKLRQKLQIQMIQNSIRKQTKMRVKGRKWSEIRKRKKGKRMMQSLWNTGCIKNFGKQEKGSGKKKGVQQKERRKRERERRTRQNGKMRSKKIKKLEGLVTKLTNHNRRLSRKFKNKNSILSSSPMTSEPAMQSPQGSTSNFGVISLTAEGWALWDSFLPVTKKKPSRIITLFSIHSPALQKRNELTSWEKDRGSCWRSWTRRYLILKSDWFYERWRNPYDLFWR